MTNKSLDETVEKIKIVLSMSHKNGTRWTIDKVSKEGRRGFHYDFAELKEQLSTIQEPVKLIKPIVADHYNELKKLVDKHNKKYENGKQI